MLCYCCFVDWLLIVCVLTLVCLEYFDVVRRFWTVFCLGGWFIMLFPNFCELLALGLLIDGVLGVVC